MSTLDKMILGFTSGLIIGILYAPAKGSKTRESIAEFGGSMKEGWDSLTDTVAATIDSFKDHKTNDNAYIMEEIQISQLGDSPDMIL